MVDFRGGPEIEISVVVPLFNEEANVEAFLARLLPVVDKLPGRCEAILVDDGSRDATSERCAAAALRDARVRPLRLSRNFGHQAALMAGLDHATGRAVITLDGDLQHPPELIPRLVELWKGGYDVVQAIRRETADADWSKKASSSGFYRLLTALSGIRVTPGAADFRLLSREALTALLACRERCRFNRGLVQWIGFPYVEVPYDAAARHAGTTKYSLKRMLRLAGDAIFSFSSAPLRFAGMAGAGVSVAAMLYLLFVVWAYLFTTWTLPGWTSTLAAVLLLGGVQLLVLWVLGEYIGRMYEELKQRPIYVIRAPTAKPASAAAALPDAQPE
jgi:polyisoprenyl-phosphate glycosyltransferase